MSKKTNVLLVMSGEEFGAVMARPEARSLEIVTASSCAEARAALAGGRAADVVVANLTLEDGNWFCVHQELARRDARAEMIVIAPRRDLDVSEILAHGVYAVLGNPLDGEELVRTIEEAAKRGTSGGGSPAGRPVAASA